MKLGADPDLFGSSRSESAEAESEQKEEDVDMMAGVRHDMVSSRGLEMLETCQ